MFLIDDDIAYKDYKDYLSTSPKIISIEGDIVTTEDHVVKIESRYLDLLESLKTPIKHKAVVENSGYKFKTY